MSPVDPHARARAGWQVRAHIHRVAVDFFGAVAVEEPVAGSASLTRPALADPLDGVRAARLVADAACGQLRSYVAAARATGRSWDDVADALDLPAAGNGSRAQVASGWLVEHRPLEPRPLEPGLIRAGGRAALVWRCGSCGGLVRDTGPGEGGHPDEVEAGHDPGCARHQAALSEWRCDLDDEDDKPPVEPPVGNEDGELDAGDVPAGDELADERSGGRVR